MEAWGRILWIETDQSFDLKLDEICIGRGPTCSICLPNTMSAASKIHCKIRKESSGGCCVIDLSANGTFLNPDAETSQRECRIKTGQCIPLKVGDIIGVTVGHRPDASAELAHFRLEMNHCLRSAVLPHLTGRLRKEDEETCFDVDVEPHLVARTSVAVGEQLHQYDKSTVHSVHAAHADDIGAAVGCKRPRAAEDVDQDALVICARADAEIGALDDAFRCSLARANLAQTEVERLHRSTEQLAAKLETARSVSCPNARVLTPNSPLLSPMPA
jgi:hypothetical protein